MRSELQHSFDAVERQRAALQSGAFTLSEGQLDWTPGAATWSVRQVIEHLVLSDETVGRACEAGSVETEAVMFRVLPRAWRRALVLNAFRHDTVLPLPSPAVEPRGDVPLSELLTRWDAARGAMGRVLEALQGNEQRFSHPVMGPLTAPQMLELSQTHTAYHVRQIEALRRDAAFPRGTEA